MDEDRDLDWVMEDRINHGYGYILDELAAEESEHDVAADLDDEDDEDRDEEDDEDDRESENFDGDGDDGDALASAGWGIDEDYGMYGYDE